MFFRGTNIGDQKGLTKENEFKSGPVPCDDLLMIENPASLSFIFKLYDMHGLEIQIQSNGKTINTSSLQNAVYNLVAIDREGNAQSQKIIVTHKK